MRGLRQLISRSLNLFFSSGRGVAIPHLAFWKEVRQRAGLMEKPRSQRIQQPEAGEQAEEGAFALPALEFGWGALGWRPYELQCAELAAGGRPGGAVFTSMLHDGWRPWNSETLSTEP